MLSDERPFSQLIFYMSFCDLAGSIGNCFGFPIEKVECVLQSVLTRYFFPASWMFTLALAFQLRCAFLYKKLWLHGKYFHAIWILALFLLLLPLIDSTFGNTDDVQGVGHSPCNFGGKSSIDYLWVLSVYMGIVFIAVLLIFYWLVEVGNFYYQGGLSPGESLNFTVTCLYPAAMIVTWFPKILYLFVTQVEEKTSADLDGIVSTLTTQNGTLLAIVYFVFNTEVRIKWGRLLCPSYFALSNLHDTPNLSLASPGDRDRSFISSRFQSDVYQSRPPSTDGLEIRKSLASDERIVRCEDDV